jgi:hypothetical protein
MNIVKTISQYNNDYVFFCEPIKNNIINEANFIRILYSTDKIIFNGIYLLLSFTDVIIEKYSFNLNSNKEIIENIKNIEISILKKINIKNKIPQYKISDQLRSGNIKLFNDIPSKNNNLFILKISGIWESQLNYGVTYKFIKINE